MSVPGIVVYLEQSGPHSVNPPIIKPTPSGSVVGRNLGYLQLLVVMAVSRTRSVQEGLVAGAEKRWIPGFSTKLLWGGGTWRSPEVLASREALAGCAGFQG